MKHFYLIIVLLLFGLYGTSASAVPDKSEALDILIRVNNYWQDNNPEPGWAFWNYAAYHTGNIEAWRVSGIPDYLDYSIRWAEANEWKGAKSDNRAAWRFDYGETDDHVLFGDWQICFQTYIDLYTIKGDPKMIARAIEVMEYQMQTDENGYWWWADGLYMVMPVMTKLYKVTQNGQYLEKLYEYFSYAKSIMYDDETGLFFRDAKYVYPEHTSYNGKKDFWARGNGWVFAGLAKVLQDLPPDNPHLDEFVTIFKKMAQTLAEAQQTEGYWTRSILDPEHAPGYETSGTAFFTYGYLWGVNNGILDKDSYLPAAESAWNYLATVALQSSGRVGYVQPIGENASPGQVVDVQSTSNFGVGAFLLACAEMIRFAPGSMPFFVYSITCINKNSVTIRFNQKVDIQSATDIQSYSSEGLTIESVSVSEDSTGVILLYADIPPGKHEVTVGSVQSVSGDTLQNSESHSFVYSDSVTVTASSYESGTGNTPDKTLDDDLDTRWSAEGNGQWILYDLNAIKEVTSVDIAFYLGNERITYFSIELSKDGISFEEVYSGQSEGETDQIENYSFEPTEARYVRITGNGNSENGWNSITEVRINANEITKMEHQPVRRNLPHKLQIYRTGSSGILIRRPSGGQDASYIQIGNLQGKLFFRRKVVFSGGYAIAKDVLLPPGLFLVTIGSGHTAAERLLVR
jgi:rhamnogalacturonyl hydrolase YesR